MCKDNITSTIFQSDVSDLSRSYNLSSKYSILSLLNDFNCLEWFLNFVGDRRYKENFLINQMNDT